MSAHGFDRCDAVTMRPENDGQDYHVTTGDPGGATRYAVTFHNFVAWRTSHGLLAPTLEDFRTAHPAELRMLRQAWFWRAVAGDRLPIGVDLVAYEIAIGSGPGWAARLLRRSLSWGDIGEEMDGALIAEANHIRPAVLIPAYNKAHWDFVNGLAGAHRFGGGWDRRITEDGAIALRWAAGATG